MAVSDRADVSGQRIGRYELIRRLAVGGMAELFLARNTGLEGFEKIVVLKRILPHLADNAEFVEMFLHEARLAATLEHPNIVHVSDFGRAGDDYFFVMAYVHGQDVLSILRAAYDDEQPMPLAHAVTITIGIAAGLHYAHQQTDVDGEPLNIVHRDVSPANILVTFDGYVKVVDFGIAKAAVHTAVTKAGVLKGKAAYMSPEQCQGDPLDRRSDVFSMGVLLWEMTTMKRLFRGENELAQMHQIVHEEARLPSSVVPDYPADLEAIVMRCLHRDPEARYPTAERLQLALEKFARDHQLDGSTRALSRYLRGLFPERSRARPPTASFAAVSRASATDVAAPTRVVTEHGPAATHGMSSAADARGVGASAPPPYDGSVTRREGRWGSRSPAAMIAGGLAVGALLGAAGWFLGSSVDPPDAGAPAPPVDSRVSRPRPTPPDPEEVEAMLVLVNQPDWELALDYPRRHRLLERLDALPGVAPRVDDRLNRALDLLQAAQAPDPCESFAAALDSIERDLQPYFGPVVRRATVPEQSEACAGLEVRRRALAGLLPAD